jgi:hypothetical protein
VHLLKWVRGGSVVIGTISPGRRGVSMKFIEKQYQEDSVFGGAPAGKSP